VSQPDAAQNALVYFEDIVVGRTHAHPGLSLTAADIIRFATEFDPEVYHTDPALAQDTPVGGLIASGVHTLGLWRRMSFEAMRPRWAAVAGAGFERMRFYLPVRPGDTLRLSSEVIGKTPSRSKPDRGVIQSQDQLTNQHGDVVLSLVCAAVVLKRTA